MLFTASFPRDASPGLMADKCPHACSVEFLLAAGPAEALRPLGAVASGGETARVMMALKAAPASVLADSGHSSAGKLLCGTSRALGAPAVNSTASDPCASPATEAGRPAVKCRQYAPLCFYPGRSCHLAD